MLKSSDFDARSRSKAKSESTSKADRISVVKSQLQVLKPGPPFARKTTGNNNSSISKVERLRKTSPPKRVSKSAPAEQSSKRPVSRYREAVEVNVPKARDPRFDSAAGAVNESQFKKNYAFLNEYKEKEIGALKEEIKEAKRKSTKGGTSLGRDAQEMERVLKRMVSDFLGRVYLCAGCGAVSLLLFFYFYGSRGREDTLTGALISHVLHP